MNTLLALALFALAQDSKPFTGVLDETSFAALHELTDAEAPKLLGADIEVGGERAYLSLPEGPALGGVVVIHEWWGLNDHIKHWTDRLAKDGYAALAIDLYEGTIATTREAARAAYGSVDREKALATLKAAHRFLVEDERVKAQRTASIGWCFGGGWSLQLALNEPELDACVIYYGRLINDPKLLGAINANVMGVFGDRDQGIPPSAVKDFAAGMKKAKRSLELFQYDAEHAFANPSSGRYDAKNAEAAWAETRAFLCRELWPEDSREGFLSSKRKVRATLPDGWSRGLKENRMRLETFVTTEGHECSVSAFRGTAGGLRPNLDRWLTQMGGVRFEDDEIAALPKIPMLGTMATLVRIDGPLSQRGKETIAEGTLFGAIATREDETVFVKLTGPTTDFAQQEAAFVLLCRSLR